MAPEIAAGEIATPDEYDCIYALVRETARGRWFLDEYAKRHRHAETQSLLAAMRRLERLAVSNSDSSAPRRMQMHVSGLIEALALAKAEIDAQGQAASPRLRLSIQAIARHAAALSATFAGDMAETEPAIVPDPASATPSTALPASDSFVFDLPGPA